MSKFIEDIHGVHLVVDSEFTACGASFDINADDEGEIGYEPPRDTGKKTVTCLSCKGLIIACRGVRVAAS